MERLIIDCMISIWCENFMLIFDTKFHGKTIPFNKRPVGLAYHNAAIDESPIHDTPVRLTKNETYLGLR